MKSLKFFAVGLLTASAMVPAFAADLGNIYVTGSSAYRAATHSALKAMFTPATLQYGYSGTDINSATFGIFTGTLAATGDTVKILTSFNGSAAGIQAIVQTTTGGVSGGPADVPQISYISPAAAVSGAGTQNLTAGVTHSSDIAMSDARVELTPFTRASDLVAVEAAGSPVGIIQFYWLKNNGANAAISGVTNQMVKAAASDALRLSFFTGNDADTGKVRVVGRNPDSGTRLVAYEEAGFGARSVPTQYLPSGATTTTAGSGDITSFSLWPAETVLGISFGIGQSGYSSGGTLRDVMKRTSSAGPIISYLGKSDATNAIGGGASVLAYNGVTPETVAPYTSFISGKYSFWSSEHVYYTEAASDAVIAVGDLLAQTVDDPANSNLSGIPNADMKVKRSAEGKVITHK